MALTLVALQGRFLFIPLRLRLVGVFSIYALPCFLPAVTSSLGSLSSTSAGVVACFDACMAIDPLTSGVVFDRIGSIRTLLVTMTLNGISIFPLWSFVSKLAILIGFSPQRAH